MLPEQCQFSETDSASATSASSAWALEGFPSAMNSSPSRYETRSYREDMRGSASR